MNDCVVLIWGLFEDCVEYVVWLVGECMVEICWVGCFGIEFDLWVDEGVVDDVCEVFEEVFFGKSLLDFYFEVCVFGVYCVGEVERWDWVWNCDLFDGVVEVFVEDVEGDDFGCWWVLFLVYVESIDGCLFEFWVIEDCEIIENVEEGEGGDFMKFGVVYCVV